MLRVSFSLLWGSLSFLSKHKCQRFAILLPTSKTDDYTHAHTVNSLRGQRGASNFFPLFNERQQTVSFHPYRRAPPAAARENVNVQTDFFSFEFIDDDISLLTYVINNGTRLSRSSF